MNITDIFIENEDYTWNHFEEWQHGDDWLHMARGYSKLFHTIFGYYNVPKDLFIP